MKPLEHIETWIFDLDNTLYPPTARLFDQINKRMTAFIMRELGLGEHQASKLRRAYWESHGATLHGLVKNHRIDPHAFLAEAHDIDYSVLRHDPNIAQAIAGLPGRKIIHTNGPRAHARAVLKVCQLEDQFEEIFALEDKTLIPKPDPRAYAQVQTCSGLDPRSSAMIEDSVGNLTVPKDMGMATVWLCHQEGAKAPDYVDRRITDLSAFLTAHH